MTGRVRKSIALLLTIGLLFSGESVQAVWHADINYLDMEYKHIQDNEFYALKKDISKMLYDSKNQEAVAERFDRMQGIYREVCNQLALAHIKTSQDKNDEYFSKEYSYCTLTAYKMSNTLSETAASILMSPCGILERENLGDKLPGLLKEIQTDTKELEQLRQREQELLARYAQLAAKEYTVTLDGRQLTAQEIDSLPDQMKEAVFCTLQQKQNKELGQVYVDLVEVRKKIAKQYGYEDYSRLCYDAYCRDYSPQDAQKLHLLVKEYISPLYGQLEKRLKAVDLSCLEKLDYSSKRMLPAFSAVLRREMPELMESYNYMVSNGLYDLDPSVSKVRSGYTILLPEYNAPFIFSGGTGGFFDLMVLTHEFGHYYSYYCRDRGNITTGSNLDLEEIHSQGLELLMMNFYKEICGTDYADSAAIYAMSRWISTVVQGCIYDEFQQEVYASDELTLEQINAIYQRLREEYGLSDTLSGQYSWVHVSHNFESPLYYISYTMSILPAWELWAAARTDFTAAKLQYLNLVEMGTDGSYLETIKECGFSNPFDENTIKNLSETIRGIIEEYYPDG